MAYKGYRSPDNSILVAGNPLVQILKVGGHITNAKPGRWVAKLSGGSDDDIQVIDGKTASEPPTQMIGFLGWNNGEPAPDTPDTRDTAYASGAYASVLCGGNFALMAVLSGVSGTKGQHLTAGESGMLTGMVTPGAASANVAQTYAFAILDETKDASLVVGRAVIRSLI